MVVERRVMKWWLWTLLLVLVIGGMAVASLSSDHPEWTQAVRWADARRLQWQQEGCPVLHGSAEAGCSRTDYRAAAVAVGHLSSAQRDRITALVDGDEGAGAGEVEPELVAATRDIIAALRRGSRRELDVDPTQRRLGPKAEAGVIDAIALHGAFGALRLGARDLARRDVDAAVALLRDGIAAAVDLSSTGIGVERLIGQQAIADLAVVFDDELLRQCSAPSLKEIDAALQLASAAMPPPGDFLEREMAHWIAVIRESPDLTTADLGVRGWWVAWRHGFSPRSYAVTQLCERLALMRRMQQMAPDDAGWSSRVVALRWLEERFRELPRDYTSLLQHVEFERTARRATASLGQLRQAIAFHLDQPMPEIPDPLGDGPFEVEIDGDTATITSGETDVRRTARRKVR